MAPLGTPEHPHDAGLGAAPRGQRWGEQWGDRSDVALLPGVQRGFFFEARRPGWMCAGAEFSHGMGSISHGMGSVSHLQNRPVGSCDALDET